MPIKECIILAGGLGTRLRSDVADLPKCMEEGLIKAGVYLIKRNILKKLNLPQKFFFKKIFRKNI